MLKAKNSLGVVFFPAYDWAISPTHPEREERLLYTQDQLREEGVFDIEGILEVKPDVAEFTDIERTHFCFPDAQAVCTRSHLISSGGAIRAAKMVMEKQVQKAFALVRPPGHHAMKCVHGSRGFCNVNIEAVMIEYLREHYGIRRVAIVDTDCHHGDGSQDVFWHDPDVLFISLHQDGRTLYPGTGFPNELGGPRALGRTINIPLPPNTSDKGLLMVMEQVVMPILADFKPELVINSAGQDNHFSDPITNMNFTAQGYAQLNEMLSPDIAVLEGGYAIQGALPYVNMGIVMAMAGLDYSHLKEPKLNRRSIEEPQKLIDYIQALCEAIPELYFNPPSEPQQGKMGKKWYTRDKDIYYDTDNISEQQTEHLRLCDHCRGVLKLETQSNRVPLSLGVEIPLGACDECTDLGYRIVEEAQVKGGYRYVQLMDRRNKKYIRHGY